MPYLSLLSSSPQYSEGSQIIPTVNSVIQQINSNALIGSVAPTSLRNAVIGGDFGTNPWQRTQSFSSITNTLTYTADRFWALGGASSSISVSRQTGTPVPGFAAQARFGRAAANADTTAIKFGQVMTSAQSTRFQGLPFVLSFWARAGSTYSAASNALNVTAGTGTGSSESAANYAAGSWTGYAGVTLYNQAGQSTTAVTLTTAFQRFSMSGVIPSTATQIGFNFAYTPVGTAGANDYVEFAGVQMEVMPQGGVTPTPFEFLPTPIVRQLCQHYFYRREEGNSSVKTLLGQCNSTTAASLLLTFPVPMRTMSTTSLSGTTVQLGSFAMTGPTGGTTSTLSSLAIVAHSGTTETINLLATLSGAGFTAGNSTYLVGGGGAGFISVDAEL